MILMSIYAAMQMKLLCRLFHPWRSRSFKQEVARIPGTLTHFAALELHLRIEGHVFGALVLQLFRIRTTIQRLKVILAGVVMILFSSPFFTPRLLNPQIHMKHQSCYMYTFMLSRKQNARRIVSVMFLATGETN